MNIEIKTRLEEIIEENIRLKDELNRITMAILREDKSLAHERVAYYKAALRRELKNKGYEEGFYQGQFRGMVGDKHTTLFKFPNFTNAEITLAILDALIFCGGINAWNGDGVQCIAQMFEYLKKDLTDEQNKCTFLKDDLKSWIKLYPKLLESNLIDHRDLRKMYKLALNSLDYKGPIQFAIMIPWDSNTYTYVISEASLKLYETSLEAEEEALKMFPNQKYEVIIYPVADDQI